MSNFMVSRQAYNMTGGGSNPTLTQDKSSKGAIAGTITVLPPNTFKITVTFDSITVHDNHEGPFSGDGEYNLFAYVQGVKISLSDASEQSNCAGLGCTGGPALYDVGEGETVNFNPGTEVTVELPVAPTVPLSIFTLGEEVDGCPKREFFEAGTIVLNPAFPGLTLLDVFKNPELDWLSAVRLFISNSQLINLCNTFDNNDELGNIVKFYYPRGQSYEPIGYGAGSHTNVGSDIGDYTLRYTIIVTPPPAIVEKHIDSKQLSNKSRSNNTSINNPD